MIHQQLEAIRKDFPKAIFLAAIYSAPRGFVVDVLHRKLHETT